MPNEHEPWPLVVEEYEYIGGVKIRVGTIVQLRCACTDSLEYDYGHERTHE